MKHSSFYNCTHVPLDDKPGRPNTAESTSYKAVYQFASGQKNPSYHEYAYKRPAT